MPLFLTSIDKYETFIRLLKNVQGQVWVLLAIFLPTFANPVYSQEVPVLGSFTDWSYGVFENPLTCYVISKPIKSVARRNNAAVTVSRGSIRFMISILPGNQIITEPSFRSGYPLNQDVPVQFRVKELTLQLFPNGNLDLERAWSRPEDDAALIAAMRGGAEAIVVGFSVRGTETTDTFSLIGFTAAIEKALELCQ